MSRSSSTPEAGQGSFEAPRCQAEPYVRMHQVAKRFGGTAALRDIDMAFSTGQVHGIVGQNGAGKSTLIGILTGRTVPSEGVLEVAGSTVSGLGVRDAARVGIRAVYQELTLVPALNAIKNVYLGQELARPGGLLDHRSMQEGFNRLCTRLGVQLDSRAPVRQLSVAQQQLVEIMRGLVTDARLLLLDEPTASLPESERQVVLQTIRKLAADGIGIVLISHALDEVLQVCDVVTVLRNGQTIKSMPATGWDKPALVSAMSGNYEEYDPEVRNTQHARPLIRAQGVTLPGVLTGVDLEVRAGEILGLAGLVGAGRTSLLRALAGAERSSVGRLWVDGVEVSWPASVRRAMGHGMVLLPESRKDAGLHLQRSIVDNLTYARLRSVSRLGVVSARKQRKVQTSLSNHLGLGAYPGSMPVNTLSGGNQQKVLLGKIIHAGPRVLLADEPARGIDISAKVEIMKHLRRLSEQGMAVIVTSSEIEDVLKIADRVLVLSNGTVSAELTPETSSFSVEEVLRVVFASEAGPTESPPTAERYP